MRKSISAILDELDKAFEKAEKELISNDWCQDEISARQECFQDLKDIFGTWKNIDDCIKSI